MPNLEELVKTKYPFLFTPNAPSGTVVVVEVGEQKFYKLVWKNEVLIPDWLEEQGALNAHSMLLQGTAEVVDGTVRWKF